jgi:hypothetical protein
MAVMSWPGITLVLCCVREPGHKGLHKDLLGIWWAGADNRSVSHDGLTYDRPAHESAAEAAASRSPAEEAPALNAGQRAFESRREDHHA